jgi:hypothetical protein
MRSLHIARAGLLAVSAIAAGCAADFDTARRVAPRGTLGRELYTVICDRVGAQALREDVTGASFRGVCHADPEGAYVDAVDRAALPPLTEGAPDQDGQPVSLARQEANRAHRIARIEALGRRREELVAALDATLPDVHIPRAAAVAATGGERSCDPAPADAASDVALHEELAATLGRLTDLYDDDTLPAVTRALGHAFDEVKADPEVQTSLARFDARQGYRPIATALGTVRPLLAYPRLVDLARSLLALLVREDGTAEKPGAVAFSEALRVAHDELRASVADPLLPPLAVASDPLVLDRTLPSRPRTLLEVARDVLTTDAAPAGSATPDFLVLRDRRGYALVPSSGVASGAAGVPSPFVDLTGPGGVPDGLADVDDVGRFVTTGGASVASPFSTGSDADPAARDSFGRAKLGNGGPLMYGYLDARRTFLASMVRDIKPFFTVDAAGTGAAKSRETAMNLLAGLPVLAGSRDPLPSTTRTYPPDADLATDWKLAHPGEPPAGLGTLPVTHAYRAFHADASPLADLAYAFGQVAATPEIDEMLGVAQALFRDHPDAMASLLGLAYEVRAVAAKHPEAKVRDGWTFWDDLFVQLARVTHEPKLMEDVIRGFADPGTLPMEKVLAVFFDTKDDISYDRAALNGPAIDRSTGTTPASFVTPVDRAQPDVGANRSEMQKFLQLLHDTNGLSICTKDGAIVHIRAVLPNTIIPIDFDYPTDTFYTPLVCGLVGSTAPAHLDKCQVFSFTNVMELLLDVLLDKAKLTVRDPCLSKLMTSSIADIAGGADKFLEQISGVDGFSLHPNLRGFARLLYFETPYPGLPTDTTPANQKTSNFLRDTIDPIPSMACPRTPFTAADGTLYALRTCATVDDTLRARDVDALFPVDELGFVKSLQPLARAFDAHQKPLYFADLFDVLHLHWGSPAQPRNVCDPSLPRTDARWCAQDGLVTYEPVFAEVLRKGVFARLQSFVTTLASIKTKHCTAFDPKTKVCTAATEVDGVHVAAEALRKLLDPTRTTGLTDRHGNALALRGDGTRKDPLAPMHLLVDAFTGIDDAFTAYAGAHPGDADRQVRWRAARSEIVDTLLAVDGEGEQARFRNTTLVGIVPKVIGLLRAQVAAHCDPVGDGAASSASGGAGCTWARETLTGNVTDTLEGPTFAALADVADAIRSDDASRGEIERLVAYLLDAASGNDAQAGMLTTLLDVLQVLEDEPNLTPFKRVLATAASAPVVADDGKVVKRGLADALMHAASRIFAREIVGTGDAACIRERDPNRALTVLLERLVTPMSPDRPAPLDVITSVIADVNRASPESSGKLLAHDYASIADEMSTFCLDGSRGLEQFYAVIHEATRK